MLIIASSLTIIAMLVIASSLTIIAMLVIARVNSYFINTNNLKEVIKLYSPLYCYSYIKC